MADILQRVGIDAEPARVHEALTTIDGIRRWWISGAEGDAAEGSAFDVGTASMCFMPIRT